jgi:hypothetical protein
MNHIRQGQNNNNSKRSRGRGRKPQNSGNRAYDSNGPDVKIRGTATHVCEKYQQLARDAITAGDRVMAENYYQHAEHYYRLIMANQSPNDGQPRPQNALGYRPDEDQDYDDDDNGQDQPQPQQAGQPYHQQNGNGQQNGGERRDNGRHNRNGNRNGRDGNREGYNAERGNGQANGVSGDDEVAARVSDPAEGEQPSIIAAGEGDVAATSEETPRRRPGRRRRPRGEAAAAGADGESSGADAGSDEVPA